MPKRSTTTGRDKTGHSDSPRQDNQRPAHGDHADAGGQESKNLRGARTQRAAGTPPDAAPPVPGQGKLDPPLPRGGRQPQRPGQDGRAEGKMGARDLDTLGLADAESGVRTDKPRPGRR
jgi:hypothetical protein